ncbi:MAG TPA: FtsQ-type POTRA domain-containing protein [Terriglobia bacterium]|jgi:cell division protein FtsQ|nr:FtsQ-type POTRA domain-containing protein [Terriglobia bacterium]
MAYDSTGLDDTMLEGDSVYRRRSKNLAVSRRHAGWRVRRLGRWFGWASITVLPAAALLTTAAWYALHAPEFALAGADAVILSGNRYVQPADVADALGAGAQPNIFKVSLGEARSEVEAIPWVRSASLRRLYPNHLLVEITERTPVAYVNLQGALKLVDSEGVILEKPGQASFDFPVIAGIDPAMPAADRKARLALYERFAQELSAQGLGAGWLVSEVDLADDGDLVAILAQGRETIKVHFGKQDFGARFRTLVALLPEVQKTTPAIDSVDLRYRGQVVVNPKEAAPAARTASTSPAPRAARRKGR